MQRTFKQKGLIVLDLLVDSAVTITLTGMVMCLVMQLKTATDRLEGNTARFGMKLSLFSVVIFFAVTAINAMMILMFLEEESVHPLTKSAYPTVETAFPFVDFAIGVIGLPLAFGLFVINLGKWLVQPQKDPATYAEEKNSEHMEW